MTFDISLLCDYEKFESPESVGLGDGYSVSAIGSGKVKVNTRQNKGERVVCWMTDVLYVPKLANNLLSVHAANSKGNTVLFRNRECCIRNKNGRVIGTGSSFGKLYFLDCETHHNVSTEKAIIAEDPASSSKIDLWHQRLAHVNHKQLFQ